MKRTILIILLVVMAFSMVACDLDTDTGTVNVPGCSSDLVECGETAGDTVGAVLDTLNEINEMGQ